MRDIKYRAKYKGKMYWVHAVYWGIPSDWAKESPGQITTVILIGAYGKPFEVGFDEVDLMQYAGLKDCDDAEIYRLDILGEIVDGEWQAIGYVDWHEENAQFVICEPDGSCMGEFTDLEFDPKGLKILGNKLESPELLVEE